MAYRGSTLSAKVLSISALSNGCVGIDCGHGTCSCSVSGGYQCRCRFGYTGEYCQTGEDRNFIPMFLDQINQGMGNGSVKSKRISI